MTIADHHVTDKNIVTMHALLYGKEVELGISTENQVLSVYSSDGTVIFVEAIPAAITSIDEKSFYVGSRKLVVNTERYDSEDEALAILNVVAIMAGAQQIDEETSEQTQLPLPSDVGDIEDNEGSADPEPGDGNLPHFPAPPAQSAVQQSKKLTDIGWDLAQWAIANRVEDDPYVDALTATIDQRGNLTAFATSNPIDLLPMPEVTAGSMLRRIARVITVTRNVLVFLPVLITWWAISRATEAYGRYIEALKERGEGRTTSFLEFWESGGVGVINPELPKFWRITEVAIKDAWIIAIIIGLTFIAGLIESFASAKRQRSESKVEKERTRIAIATMVALQGNKSVDTESLTDTLAIALNDLGQAARDVNLAAERMEAASVGVSSLTPRVAELSENVSNLSDQFSTDVQVSIQALVTAVSALGNTLEGDLQRFMSEVLTGLEEVSEGLKTTMTHVEFGTHQMREDLDAIHARLKGLINSR
jgi:hypothetical protein